ncbi:hypothetical protein [Paenibacillus koleovorans]|uniref:hypothetical protein n=1 Tax=Paenibacillus koleovorans TaxID=121608 RepID=UPI000FDB118D|nr:hypothetical protein [Paenibacillus koleovorans]
MRKIRLLKKGLAIAAALCIWSSSALPALASGNPWYDKYVAFETGGSTLNPDTSYSLDSGVLAFQESYMLRSFLSLYQSSLDTGWLDKFVTRANRVKSNAQDLYGDGYLGWESKWYSPNLATNGTFASAASGDATLPAGWTRSQSTSTTAYRSATSGDYKPSTAVCGGDTQGFVLKTNAVSWQKLYQPLGTYEPGKKYNVRFDAKTNGSAAKGRAYVVDASNSNAILGSVVFDNTAWAPVEFDFVTPGSAGHTLQLWLAHNDYTVAGGIAYFDNVAVSAYYPYILHDGIIGTVMAEFIRLVYDDSTNLSSYTTTANAYKTFIENELVAKWEDSGSYVGNTWVNVSSTEGYYREPTTRDTFSTATVLNPLPYNQFLVMAELQAIMYGLNGNSSYLTKAQKMGTFFKNDLATVSTGAGTAYSWGYLSFDAKKEDISHANLDLSVAIELYQAGQVFNATDMERFSRTLTELVWNQSTSSPLLHNYVDGSQGSACQDFMWTYDMPGWMELAQFDKTVWEIGAGLYAPLTPSRKLEALVIAKLMEWDPAKLANRGFEWPSKNDATLPVRWNRSQATSATAYLDSSNKRAGKYGLTLVSNGTSWQKAYQNWSGYMASTSYVLTFDAKTDGSAAGGKVWIVDATSGTTLQSYNFSNTSWQTHSVSFTSPANASNQVSIYVGHNDFSVNGGKAHFDNVAIKRPGDAW